MNMGSVEGKLILEDLFTGVIDKAEARIGQLEKRMLGMGQAAQNLGKSHATASSGIDKFVKSIQTTLVHVATAALAYKSLSEAMDSVTKAVEFERSMMRIANVTSVTSAELTVFRGKLDALREASGRGPQELADGFYAVASSMDSAATATDVLANASKLAAIGLGETKDISRALAAAINSYGAANLSAATAADQLLVAVRLGGAEASEFSSALGRVTGLAAQMGISFAEVSASVATFTRLGVGADEAVTALRGTMVALLNPTEKGIETLAQYGLTFEDLRRSVKDKGLADTLIDLRKTVGDNDEALQKIIPNVRALAGFLANTGEQASAYRDILAQVEHATGAVDEANTRFQNSAAGRWDQMKAGIEAAKLSLGEALLPAILHVGEAMERAFTSTGTSVDDLAKSVAILAGAFAGLIDLVIKLDGWVGPLATKLAILNKMSGLTLLADIFSVNGTGAKLEAETAATALGGVTVRMAELDATVSHLVRSGNLGTLTEQFDIVHTAERDLRAEQARLTREITELSEKTKGGIPGTAALAQEWLANSAKLKIAQQRQAEVNVELSKTTENVGILRNALNSLPSPDKIVPPGGGGQGDAFTTRISEVLEGIKAQTAAVRERMAADAAASADRIAQIKGEERMQSMITDSARIEAEVVKVMNSLQSDKNRLTAAQVALVREYVATLTRAKIAEEAQSDELAAQERKAKLIAAAKVQLLVLIEKQAERERAMTNELKKQAQVIQDQLIDVQHQANLADARLSGLLNGGTIQAAREAELYVEYTQQGVENAAEIAGWQAQIEESTARTNYWVQQLAEVAKPAWQRYAELALGAIDAVVDALSSALSQALRDGEVDWKSLWDGLMDQLLDMFVKMLADMLKQWLVTQAAMAASDYAAGASGYGSGGGAGGGMMGSAMSMGGSMMTGSGGTSGGFISSSGVGGASWSTVGIAAFWVAFVAYAGYMAGVWGKKGKDFFASGTIGGSGTDMSITDTGGTDLKNVTNRLNEVIQGIKDFLKVTDIQMDAIADVTLAKIGHTYTAWVDTIHGRIQPGFATAEEAMEWVAVAAIKYGTFADSVSELMKTVITHSKAMNREQLAADIEFARMIENLGDMGMGEGELALRNSLSAAVDQFLADAQRAQQLLGSNTEMLGDAIEKLGMRLVQSFQSAYDQIMGVKQTPQQELDTRKAQATMFNAQKKLAIAELNLKKYEMEAKLAFLQGQERLAQAQGDIYTANLEQMKAYLEALGIIIGELIKIPDINPGDLVPRGLGGGGGKGGDDPRDWYNDRLQGFNDSLMSDYARQVAEINRLYAEQLRLAGDDAALRADLIALQERELALLRAEARQRAIDAYRSFMGLDNPFTQLKDEADAAVKAIMESPMANWRKAQLIADIWDKFGERVHEMALEMQAGLFGSLASDLEALGLGEMEAAELRRYAAIMEHELKMAHYRAEFEMLKALGQMTPAMEAAFERALALFGNYNPASGGAEAPYLPEQENMGVPGTSIVEHKGFRWKWDGSQWLNLGPIPGTTPPGGSGGGSTGGLNTYEEYWKQFADNLKRAKDMLADWMTQGVHPLIKSLMELEKDFSFLKEMLGDTAEVHEAYARRLAQILNEYIDPLREYLANMDFDQFSVVSGEGKFYEAQAQFRDMLAKLQGGDLTQLDNVTAFADRYRELAGLFTGGNELRNIDQEVRNAIAAIIGMFPGFSQQSVPLGATSNPMSMTSPALQQVIEIGNGLVVTELRTANTELKVHSTELRHIRTALYNPLSVRTVQ